MPKPPKGVGVKSAGNVRLTWNGEQVKEAVRQNVAQAWTEIGLRVETEAKRELYKGHGVVTGTLRRSIHTATPGYDWSSDNVIASDSTPERGGQMALPSMESDGIRIQVGSGLVYALAIHQGFEDTPFQGYHYLRNALQKVKPKINTVLKKYGLKK